MANSNLMLGLAKGAGFVEDAFGDGLARDGVDDNVSARDDTLHGGRSVADEILSVLEGEMARE